MPGSPTSCAVAESRPTTVDRLLGGRLSLYQGRAGHRAGTDAVLLAAAAAAMTDPGSFVDVGAGVGTAGLALALRWPGARGLLLEADPGAAELGRCNCTLNGVQERVAVVQADLFNHAACQAGGLLPERAALVVTNPPFYRADEVRASPDAGRAAAHVLGPQSHGDWLRAAVALLAPSGRFLAIHRPAALPALLLAAAGRLGALVVRPVRARPRGDAVRILLGGTKGSRAPLRIAPDVVLHADDGSFTAEAEAIHQGHGTIAM
jgi:tRNA1(Val) A37 N6-methylase TrmN6